MVAVSLRPVFACGNHSKRIMSVLLSFYDSNNILERKAMCYKTQKLPLSSQSGLEEDHDVPRGEGVVSPVYNNRNPRSLELMGMERKPRGYGKGIWRVDYYHRLMLHATQRHITGYVEHNNTLRVVEASTTEYCIGRHLYKTSDVTAAYNVGRVLAERCKEMGIYRMLWEHKRLNRNSDKVKAFLRAFSEASIILNEPKVQQTMPPSGRLPKGLNIANTTIQT